MIERDELAVVGSTWGSDEQFTLNPLRGFPLLVEQRRLLHAACLLDVPLQPAEWLEKYLADGVPLETKCEVCGRRVKPPRWVKRRDGGNVFYLLRGLRRRRRRDRARLERAPRLHGLRRGVHARPLRRPLLLEPLPARRLPQAQARRGTSGMTLGAAPLPGDTGFGWYIHCAHADGLITADEHHERQLVDDLIVGTRRPAPAKNARTERLRQLSASAAFRITGQVAAVDALLAGKPVPAGCLDPDWARKLRLDGDDVVLTLDLVERIELLAAADATASIAAPAGDPDPDTDEAPASTISVDDAEGGWFESAADLLAEPDPGPTPFLVDDLIVEAAIAAIVGSPKNGKTWSCSTSRSPLRPASPRSPASPSPIRPGPADPRGVRPRRPAPPTRHACPWPHDPPDRLASSTSPRTSVSARRRRLAAAAPRRRPLARVATDCASTRSPG